MAGQLAVHAVGGEKEICKAPLPVAPPQIAQSPAAKMPDQKGSTTSALESSRSLIFPTSDTPKFAIYHFCATKRWDFSKFVDVHSVRLGFQDCSCIYIYTNDIIYIGFQVLL